jgi:hypothetical protein
MGQLRVLPARRPKPATPQQPNGVWIFIPALAVVLGAIFLVLFSPFISWALGGGTHGVFVARFVDCHKGCAWIGNFDPADHSPVLHDVPYVDTSTDGLPGLKTGERLAAVDISSKLFGNTAYSSRPQLGDILHPAVWPILLLALVMLAAFLAWVWRVPVRYWRWRLQRGGRL